MAQRDDRSRLIAAFAEALERELSNWQFARDDLQQVYAALALGSITELASALPPLLDKSKIAAAVPVVRSMLELVIDLECVVADASMLERLQANVLERHRVFASHYLENSEFPAEGKPKAQLQLEQCKKELQDLKEDGYKPISIHDRFRKAGKLEWFRVFYHQLSGNSHNSLQALTARHCTVEESGRLTLKLFVADSHLVQMCLVVAGEAMSTSLNLAAQVLGETLSDEVEKPREELKQVLEESGQSLANPSS